MVLKPSPSGEVCIGFKKAKKGQEPEPCEAPTSHAWYAGPLCKNCYLRNTTAGGKRGRADSEEEAEDTTGDVPVDIHTIYGSRCLLPAAARP